MPAPARCVMLSIALLGAAAPAHPHRVTYRVTVRSYIFGRTNASGYGLPQDTGVTNQSSANHAIALHLLYPFARNWRAAAAYLYANPMNGCAQAAQQMQSGGPCSGKSPAATNPDNTLPGFALSTLYESYVQYGGPRFSAIIGREVLNTPWANAADTRVKPESYEGALAALAITPRLTLEAGYVDKFESRVDSDFVSSTLLTATNQADAPGPGANLLIPKYSSIATAGFAYWHAGYTSGAITANAYAYRFVDIAAAEWFDLKYTPLQNTDNAFVALQGGLERDTGRSILGKIDSRVIGMQAGLSPSRSLDMTVGIDVIPQQSRRLTLPAGVTCTAIPAQPLEKTPAGHEIAVSGKVPLPYFLPSGGTPDCTANSDGTATVYYGGWASPYTDSYTSDPLYTTSMTGGMIERRSPGASAKATVTWWSDLRRVRLIASFAMYRYGNAAAGIAPARELDLDGTYYFSRIPESGPYTGFSLRDRYGERDMGNVRYYGGLPVFKYNRLQVEYDF